LLAESASRLADVVRAHRVDHFHLPGPWFHA
jgi:hypothetical protein